ncbi:MAG: hypothetical protein WHX53_11915, partial [Anaerolineae bacterium]
TWTADPAGAVVDDAAAAAVGEAPGRYAFDAHGLDAVSFLVSANPGEPLRPLARVASGGETSRLMLALKTVLGRADETPTLIFDEIDQGIGGRVGATVGRKLWGLTRGEGGNVKRHTSSVKRQTSEVRRVTHDVTPATVIETQPLAHQETFAHQVLCITHLPQLAAYGDVHFHVAKHVVGERTVTQVTRLVGDDRVIELARMLGADTETGRASVIEMMQEVENIKWNQPLARG